MPTFDIALYRKVMDLRSLINGIGRGSTVEIQQVRGRKEAWNRLQLDILFFFAT